MTSDEVSAYTFKTEESGRYRDDGVGQRGGYATEERAGTRGEYVSRKGADAGDKDLWNTGPSQYGRKAEVRAPA